MKDDVTALSHNEHISIMYITEVAGTTSHMTGNLYC